MLYGIFPFFTFGFLMTTYPKWMNGRTVPGGSYIPTFFLMTLGIFLFYVGIFLGKGFIVAGIIIHSLAWIKGFLTLFSIYQSAVVDSKYHPFHLNITVICGIVGELFFLLFMLLLSCRSSSWFLALPLATALYSKPQDASLIFKRGDCRLCAASPGVDHSRLMGRSCRARYFGTF